jgi:hypothetical protein
MAAKSIELANLFATVAQALSENEDALNRADEFNHDHGTNMVTTFHIIADAVREKQGSSNSEALSYAAQQLQLKGTGGSARLYAQNLQQAANAARGTTMTPARTLELLQTLMGGEQERQAEQAAAKPTSGLAGLLGNLMGAVQQQQVQQPVQASGNDLGGLLGGLLGGPQEMQQPAQSTGGLDSLLSGLLGGQTQASTKPGIGMGSIMGIISALLGSGQSTGSGAGLGALVQAFTGGSGTSQSYRKDSSGIVVNTVLQAIMDMMAKR